MPSDSRKYTTYRSNTSCTLSCSERSDRSTKCGLWVAKLATGPCNRQLDGNMLLVQQLSYQEKHEAYGMLRFSKPWKDRYRSLLSGPKISSAFLRVSSRDCLWALSSLMLAKNAPNCSYDRRLLA